MYQTVEAIIERGGAVRLLEAVNVNSSRRAILTILDEEPEIENENYLLSEASLAVDWNRPEEDAAWAHLQSVP